MPNQTVSQKIDAVEVQVSVVVFQENDAFVAYCPALDLSSYGDTEEEAKEAFGGAMNIFLTETTKRGTLEKYLLRLGWILQQKPNRNYQSPVLSLQESKKLLDRKANIYNERVAMPL